MRSIERVIADYVSAVRMEHRWGRRQPTDLAVHVIAKLPGTTAAGRVLNISLTGAYVETTAPLRVHALVYLESRSTASAAGSGRRNAASVVRRDASGVGLEWCESASERPSVEARIGILAGAAGVKSPRLHPVSANPHVAPASGVILAVVEKKPAARRAAASP